MFANYSYSRCSHLSTTTTTATTTATKPKATATQTLNESSRFHTSRYEFESHRRQMASYEKKSSYGSLYCPPSVKNILSSTLPGPYCDQFSSPAASPLQDDIRTDFFELSPLDMPLPPSPIRPTLRPTSFSATSTAHLRTYHMVSPATTTLPSDLFSRSSVVPQDFFDNKENMNPNVCMPKFLPRHHQSSQISEAFKIRKKVKKKTSFVLKPRLHRNNCGPSPKDFSFFTENLPYHSNCQYLDITPPTAKSPKTDNGQKSPYTTPVKSPKVTRPTTSPPSISIKVKTTRRFTTPDDCHKNPKRINKVSKKHRKPQRLFYPQATVRAVSPHLPLTKEGKIASTTNLPRTVEVLDENGAQKHIFKSCSDAAREMNINRTRLSRLCRSGGGIIGKYTYRYLEMSKANQDLSPCSVSPVCHEKLRGKKKRDLEPSILFASDVLLKLKFRKSIQ